MAGVKARLWNRSARDFHQEINETAYDIPAGKFLTMGLDEAVMVQGFYPGKGVPWPVEVERMPLEDSLKLYTCPKEGDTFGTQAELDKHLATHSDQIKSDTKDEQAGTKVLYACPACDDVFSTKAALKNHLRVHYDKKKDVEDAPVTSTTNSNGAV
jgi:uncharacterized C2H2 Zn-finger protein